MKNRLEIARDLLRDDGVIFVQCDDNEQAYLKVLMDEIFGARRSKDDSQDNFVSCITHIVKPEGRMYGNIAKTHEYILIYAKSKQELEFNEIEKVGHKFSFKDEHGGFDLKNLENGNFREFNVTNRPNLRYPFYVDTKSIGADGFMNISTIENKEWIAILPSSNNNIQYVWRWGSETAQSRLNELVAIKTRSGKISIYQKVRSTTTRAKSIFQETNMITKRGTDELKALFANASDRSVVGGEGESLREGEGSDFAIQAPSPSLKKEKTARDSDTEEDFAEKLKKHTPKPEALLKRIIEISTKEGDLVLDFFAGSGTTLAVAHKMGRRWIGIEQMDYVESITKERLKKVIEGEQGGVSKAVEWNGGGEFVYAELMGLNLAFREKIEKAKEAEIEGIYSEIKEWAFLDYRTDGKIEKWEELTLEERKAALMELLDSNMDYLPYSEIRDKSFCVGEADIELNGVVYGEKK